MGKTTQQPDESTTYERMPNEPDEAWNAFCVYRDMGPRVPGKPGGRTTKNVQLSLGKGADYWASLQQWSVKWQWVKRARKYDDELEKKNRKLGESKLPYWAKMRDRSHRLNMKAATQVRKKVAQMLARGIDSHEVREINGREVMILSPRWTLRDIGTLLKIAAELEAGTITDAMMMNAEEQKFDPSTASIEELRDYISKATGKKPGVVE